MRVPVALVGCFLVACSDEQSAIERCNTVRSWSSQPLGYDFLTAEPVPVSLTDDGLNQLLALSPPSAKKYANFCAAVYSGGDLMLTPNIPEPVEAFVFRQENGKWIFVKISEIYHLR